MPSLPPATDPIAPVARLSEDAQDALLELQVLLIDVPYIVFGRCVSRSDCTRYNVVFPSTFGSARRKPVRPRFQAFAEDEFWPLAQTLLFGEEGWINAVQPFLLAHKVNTLAIGEDEDYYGEPIFHLHVDGRVGRRDERDAMQRRRYRLLTSLVPRSCPAEERRSTVYLREQPDGGVASTDAMHRWAASRFEECGLSRGKRRPLYRVPLSQIVRAVPGDVHLHASHGHGTINSAYPVHAEANPCPPGRAYHAIDLDDAVVLKRGDDGRVRGVAETRRVPIERIIRLLDGACDAARLLDGVAHLRAALLRRAGASAARPSETRLLCAALSVLLARSPLQKKNAS